jgi:Fic family protein
MENLFKISKLKSELDSLRPLKKEEEQRIMQKFRLDWNYHSNNLEGNPLTYGETKALILFGITAQGKTLKDHLEVTGHDEAIKWILDVVKEERPLTENFIRELHKLILKDSYEVNAITPDGNPTKKTVKVGQYKTTPNHVKTATGEIFRFASPEETPALMEELINWLREEIKKKDANPVLIAARFHYRFIRIHPFDDGNGRTARILMNFILLQNDFPPVIIKTEDKENYFSVLRQADAGIIEPFIEYIAENLIRSLEIMVSGAKGEDIEEPDDLDKEISLLEQKLKSIDRPVKITKSKQVITNIFDSTIYRFATNFFEKSEKFENFYIHNRYEIIVTPGGKGGGKEEVSYKTARMNISSSTRWIRILAYHEALNQRGLHDFIHESWIQFNFDNVEYYITNRSNKIHLKKLYSEQLSDEEIIGLINLEIKYHKDLIERQIDELKKEK